MNTKRVQVVVRWHPGLRGLVAHDLITGQPISNYSQLNYGDTPAARIGDADDGAVLAATVARAVTLSVVRDRNGIWIDPKATHIGWVTVPDE